VTGREPFFELRRSPIQGRGAFAVRRIRKGTRIIEYTGERIDDDEADRRYDDDAMDRHHTFLFAVKKNVVIDAAVGGNEARFINHSCDPNCEAVIYDDEVWIEALRTIHPGEELAYDYKYERDGEADGEWEKLYVCRCGAANCRGTILQAPKRRKAAPPKRDARRRRGKGRDTRRRADAETRARRRA
jgi:SET domain-containing protein